MNVPALGILLVLLAFSSSGDFVEHGPRLLFCPGYRATDAADATTASAPEDVNRRSDPLWLLQKEDEWIPLRSGNSEHSSEVEGRRPNGKFFGCFIYNLAVFGHYVLDFFFPYIAYPYYRAAFEPDGLSPPALAARQPLRIPADL